MDKVVNVLSGMGNVIMMGVGVGILIINAKAFLEDLES